MNELTSAPAFAVQPSPDGSNDASLVELWLSLKVSSHTRRAYAADVKRFLMFVAKPLGWVTLADVQAYAAALGQGSLKQSEVAKLIEAAPEGRDRVLLKLLYVSGVRVSELCGLKWCDTMPRVEGGQIAVFGKRGRTRTILLKPKFWSQLLAIRGGAGPADPVFRSRKGGGHLDASQVRRIVYAAAKKTGLEQKVSPHWMRHAHASHALDRSAPIHLVQATLGHASVSTTGRYLHARPTESSSFYLPD